MLELTKNIDTLQNSIYGSNFDISTFFASDKQVVKNILINKNPTMKKEDAETMVSGKKGVAVYPLPSNHGLYGEAGKAKKEVRDAALGLVKEQKALIQDLIMAGIKIGNAIPAITILVAPLSFNAPAAISLLLVIIDALKAIINRIMEILKHLEPLKKLSLVIDSSKLDTVMSILNIALAILLAIFEPISILKKIIDMLMGQLNKTTSEAKIVVEGVTQSATFSAPPAVKDGDFDESALAETLNTIKGVSPILNNLHQLTATSSEVYVYNVEFSDGRKMTNVSEEDIENIKEKYKVIFR